MTLVSCGDIKTNPRHTHGARLRVIRKALEELYSQYKFDIVVRERGFSRFPKETQALFKAHGVAEEYFCDFIVYDYAPSSVKKTVTGSGKASKQEVEEAVRKLFKLADDFKFVSDNASDAVAVGFTHIKLKGA